MAQRYRDEGVPLVVVAGSDYGTGSSRDWAAKGTSLLGVRAVIAESFERIHRSNLIGMGVLPLQLLEAKATDFTGTEVIDVVGGEDGDLGSIRLLVDDADVAVRPRVDTAAERTYLAHGGILPYIARRFAGVVAPPRP